MKFTKLTLSAACSALALAAFGTYALAGGGAIPKQLQEEATLELEDKPQILKAPPPDARRVYVIDTDDFNAVGRIVSIDGGNAKIVGQTDTGLVANAVVSSDGKFFAHASTLFSRVAKGKRDDYIEVYDAETHEVIADIDIPEIRFLVNTYQWMMALTPDDKSLLLYQFAPSPGVGLVDLEQKKFVKLMDVPDCYHIFPTASDTFYMHCRQGHLLKATFDKQGNIKHENTKVFHPEDKHLVNLPAYSTKAKRLVWPSYDGTIYQVDLSGAEPKFDSFEAFTDEEKAAKWAPGGWNVVAYHRPSNRIYLLADQREKFTHKSPSRFVFVYDAATGKRLKKFQLEHEVNSIGVSADANPQLYGLSAHDRAVYIYDPESGKQTGKVGQVGRAATSILTMD